MLNSDFDATEPRLSRVGLDGIAVKPTECDVSTVVDTVDAITIDYEGRESIPDGETLRALAERSELRLTTPVRADGYDPLGDDSLARSIPDGVGRVLVAGHPAYLDDQERRRAVAPRFGAALETTTDAWVGTESVERIAMATGAPQFELLSASTERDVRAMRAAGFDGEIAIYAPTVLTDDGDEILDAVGGYVARRRAVATALPEGAATDSRAVGPARETLLEASADFALVGTDSAVSERVNSLRAAGASTIVGYPAAGIEQLLG